MVIDTQATPVMAQDVIRRIREVTDKPIRYVVMSHYHAVRVLGATALRARAHHRQPRHLRPHRRARRAGHEERDRALSASVPRGGVGAGADVADARVREAAHAVARHAAGRDPAARARPHQGRHGGVAAAGADPVLRRPRGVRRHAVHGRRLPRGLAGHARCDRRAVARASSSPGAVQRCRIPRSRPGIDGTRPSSPRCTTR